MNRKAFTLIELLAVIAILSTLTLIVVINITNYLNKADEVSYNTLVTSIKSAAESYVVDHQADYPELDVPGSSFNITLQYLVNDGYVKANLVDERTGQNIPLNTTLTINVISQTKIEVVFNYE